MTDDHWRSGGNLEDHVLKLAGGGGDENQQDECTRDGCITFIQKNIRSLFGEQRFEELLEEVHAFHWDVVFVSETWREQFEEDIAVRHGDRWIGSSGQRKQGAADFKHGVGVLLHERWARAIKKVTYQSSRLLSKDLEMHCYRFRLICVYMPYAEHADREI